ncbi:hypothetical protein LLG95_19000 [bacterium]|nr:hypothetical protein [bacterium]
MLAAGFSTTEGHSRDRLHVLALEAKDLRRTGILEGPANRAANHFRIAALEPVEGKLLAVATSDKSVYFYRREGSSLERLNFEGPLVEGELAMGSDFVDIDTLDWQP